MDKRIGAQLFTLRASCKTAEDLDASFAKLQKIGYKTIQVSGIGPIPATVVKETADKYGLQIVCTHRSIDDFRDNLDGIIADQKAMDCKIAGLGSMPPAYKEDLKTFFEIVNTAAKKLKEEGLQFAYHNHAFEFEKYDGRYLMDMLIEDTNPDEFKFIVDTYWLAIAGQNPAEFIKKLGDRVAAVHFKDLAMDHNTAIMAEVMEGNLDWDSIFEACEQCGAEYALVEQDVCRRDPFESMEISYNNLVKKGFC